MTLRAVRRGQRSRRSGTMSKGSGLRHARWTTVFPVLKKNEEWEIHFTLPSKVQFVSQR